MRQFLFFPGKSKNTTNVFFQRPHTCSKYTKVSNSIALFDLKPYSFVVSHWDGNQNHNFDWKKTCLSMSYFFLIQLYWGTLTSIVHILQKLTTACLESAEGRKYFKINLHERMLPTSAGVEPTTSWSPVGWRIQLSHLGWLSLSNRSTQRALTLDIPSSSVNIPCTLEHKTPSSSAITLTVVPC